MTTAGIYTRLSLDQDGTSTATKRQQQDCEEVAARLGLDVVRVYEDNDISAFDRKKRRPAFEQMILDVAAGKLDHVIVWRSDRLARQPADLERFILACEKNGSSLLSVTEPEFGGRTGLLVLRMLVNFAAHESGVKSERVARRIKADAEGGRQKNGGLRPFGYVHENGQPWTPHPVEAPLYREAVDRVLAGEKVNAILRDWRQRGVQTVTARGPWRTSNFHRLLRSPSQAGIRSYHGRLLDGNWEPLIDRERWERLQAVLDGRRPTGERVVTRHVLSGLARCGACGTRMQGVRIRQSRSEKVVVVYRCSKAADGCGRVSIDGARLEEIVGQRFLHVVNTDAFAQLVAGRQEQGEDAVLKLMAQLREDEAALEQLTKDHYVDRSIPRPAFLAAKDALEARIADARAEVARHATPALSASYGDAEALRRDWATRGPAWQRSVLEALVRRVVVQPAVPGKRGPTWWTDRVQIEWLV